MFPNSDSQCSCSSASPSKKKDHPGASRCCAPQNTQDGAAVPQESSTGGVTPALSVIQEPLVAGAPRRRSQSRSARKEPTSGTRGRSEQLSPEEEERKRIRRERNKIAAAKCRNRRRELTDTLQAETDKLEEEKAALEGEISGLLKEKEQLELILAAHKPACKVGDEPSSPQPVSPPSSPRAAISGNSNVLLCSTGGDGEALLDDLLLPAPLDVTRYVPDIDITVPLGTADWDTLYKSVSGDLEELASPSVPAAVTTPTCGAYLSSFAFTFPEFDLLADGNENQKTGGAGKCDMAIDLNSPTLLAL